MTEESHAAAVSGGDRESFAGNDLSAAPVTLYHPGTVRALPEE